MAESYGQVSWNDKTVKVMATAQTKEHAESLLGLIRHLIPNVIKPYEHRSNRFGLELEAILSEPAHSFGRDEPEGTLYGITLRPSVGSLDGIYSQDTLSVSSQPNAVEVRWKGTEIYRGEHAITVYLKPGADVAVQQ
jgi:hypothetical protein